MREIMDYFDVEVGGDDDHSSERERMQSGKCRNSDTGTLSPLRGLATRHRAVPIEVRAACRLWPLVPALVYARQSTECPRNALRNEVLTI